MTHNALSHPHFVNWGYLPPDPLLEQLRLSIAGIFREDADAWHEFSEMGLWDFCLPSAAGGLDLGVSAAAVVVLEAGRAACPLPLVHTLTGMMLFGEISVLPPFARTVVDGIREGRKRVYFPLGLPTTYGTLSGTVELTATRHDRTNSVVMPLGLDLLERLDTERDQLVLAVPVASDGLSITILRPPSDDTSMDLGALNPEFVGVSGLGAEKRLLAVGERTAILQTAFLVGLAAAAIEAAADRVRSRTQFGVEVVNFQHPRLELARAVVEIDALTEAVRSAAAAYDSGTSTKAATSGLLALASETARRVSRDALHLGGANALVACNLPARIYNLVTYAAQGVGPLNANWLEAAEFL